MDSKKHEKSIIEKIVIYQNDNLVDKIIVACHPTLCHLRSDSVSNHCNYEEYNKKITNKDAIFIGNCFSKHFL